MKEITYVEGGIHRPDEPKHFMRIKNPEHEILAEYQGVEIARSRRTKRVHEVGFDLYDPVVYFPREDVKLELLKRTEKSTHCPLKGDTEYFDINGENLSESDAAWSYVSTFEFSSELKDYVAFDTSKVQVTEYTVG